MDEGKGSRMKLWGGRFEKETAQEVEEFSRSLSTDAKMWSADIQSSIAHARMLGTQKIISLDESQKIIKGLMEISEEIQTGKYQFDLNAEDLHSEIEAKLTEKIGAPAKKLHTARSRNDQVATDLRLHLASGVKSLLEDLTLIKKELLSQAEKHTETILPGMTHFQHAQPVSLAHHLLAYFWMFERDAERLTESLKRILVMPLGSAALAGTGFPIDRSQAQKELGFLKISENSLDAVSDRDFVIEFLSQASIIMMHLSRLSEELIVWSTPEFGFVELGDEVTTGSSIMPQKKNPDVTELIRGRVGRLYGALVGSLTMMKALPLSYNRDMQEDKIHLFEGLETVSSCVKLMNLVLQKTSWKAARMAETLKKDFSNATDVADDLAEKGVPFREAHEISGNLVQMCLREGFGLEDLTLPQLQKFHPLFDEKSVAKLSHIAVMRSRTSEGGTSPSAVKVQIEKAKASLS